MRKSASLTSRIISMLLAIILVFYTLPLSVIAQEISNSNTSTAIPSNTSEGQGSANNNTTTQKPYTYYNEVYEEATLREESVKHFRLEDGSYVAAQYASPVHYLDEEGEWQNIDNALAESGSEFVTSDARVKFIKKTTGNGNIFTLHDGNAKITLGLVGANKKVSGIVTNTDETETTKLGKLMNLEELSSSIRYNEIFDGVDIEYVLDSLNVKENIIIKDKNAPYSYTFELALNGLEAELLENGDISITKGGEPKYTIPAPVVFDSADNTAPSTAAGYTLTDNGNGKYTLTASVSSEWMNSPDRVYPVTLDPAIITGSDILDTYGTIGTPSSNGASTTLTVSQNQIALFSLLSKPNLPKGAHISDAKLILTRTAGTGSFIGVYTVENNWSVLSYDVGNVVLGELIDHCSTRRSPSDTDETYANKKFAFDITKAVRAWYNTPTNHGLALKSVEGSSATHFAASHYSDISMRPSFTISYVNTLGVEDYYSYSTQSAGAAGTGYVNHATGDLTFSIGTLTSTDYLMPVTPSLVYNSALANKYYNADNTNTAVTSACTAYGFKLNLTETLVRRGFYTDGALKYYFIWCDSDGTEHFFYPTSTQNIYCDDSGLLLELNTSGSSPIITDINKNKRSFSAVGESSYSWKLSSITDRNNNRITLSYNTFDQIVAVNLGPNGYGTTTMLSLAYNAGILYRVLNPASKKAVFIYYSDTPGGEISTTASKYLRKIVYAHGTDDSPSWSTYYNSGTASDVVTDATMYYEYDANGYLLSAKNGLADYTVNYEWASGKVSSVYEQGGTTQGVKIGFTYGEGYTEVTTPGTDGNYSTTADNIISHYSYDKHSRIVSTYSMSYDRGTIYGASVGVYSDTSNDATELVSASGDGTKNKLTEAYAIGGASTNYLLNGDFLAKSDSDPIPYWETSHSTITVGSALRDEAITIPCETSDTYLIYQYVYLPDAGDYTVSFDISSSNTNGIVLHLSPSANDTRVNLDDMNEASKWYTVSKTFNVPYAKTVKIEISITRKNGATFDTTPYVYLSKARLEKGIGGGSYNYVKMGDFVDTYRSTSVSNPTNVGLYTFWSESDAIINYDTTQAVPYGDTAKILGEFYEAGTLSQTIYTAPQSYIDSFGASDAPSNSGRSYIVSGFAKGDDLTVSNDKSKFALRADVYYYQGVNKDDIVVSHYFNFNPDLTDWQFISGSFNTYKENEFDDSNNAKFYDVVSRIDIVCEYSHQSDSTEAFFDKISVIDADTTLTKYEYENGQISKILGRYENEYREYDDYGRLIRVADDSGNLVIYSYNSKSQITSETTYSFKCGVTKKYPYDHINDAGVRDPLSALTELTPKLHTVYKYDNDEDQEGFGLLIKTETYPAVKSGSDIVQKSGTASIITTNTYETTAGSAIFGALLETSDGAGHTVKYFYDTAQGYLLAEINVEAGTGTAYTYDGIGNLISVQPATYTSSGYSVITNAESVSYEYNAKNQLSSIVTETTEYNFTYDSFGAMSRFVEGNVNYYYDKAGNLIRESYTDSDGNYFEYLYTYDVLGRLISEDYYADIYEQYEDEDGYIWDDWYTLDGNLKKYEYTSDGKLYRVHDGLNNEYTQYSYDYNGRLESVVTYGGDFVHDFVTEYYYSPLDSTKDRISSKYQTFTYRVGTASADKCIGTLYYYDAYERLSTERISSDNVTAQLSYSYDDYSRLIGKTTASGSFTNEVTYGYRTTNGVTTGEIVTYTSKVGNSTNTYTYTYDSRGNIKTVKKGTALQYEYSYDDLGQLISESDYTRNTRTLYTYDKAGNILQKRIVDLTASSSDVVVNYTYGNSANGDRLTSFNGELISYDSSGRTVYYRGKAIAYFDEDANAIQSIGNAYFTYNADGLRRTKYVNGVKHTYYYDGINIVKEEWGNNTMVFLYDSNGSPVGMQYRNSSKPAGEWDTYYYEKNLQGDIVAIYNASGAKLANYTYDAWGRILSITDGNNQDVTDNASHIGNINPLRYRGYYYDDDLDLYYLSTRYYDPETCRFVTADSYVSTGQGILGHNRFAYCGNNPVMRVDISGEFWVEVICIIVIVAELVVAGIALHNELSISNKENNAELDNNPSTSTQNRLVENQNLEPASLFKYGAYSCSHNGCEAIALHNARVMLGMESSLSSVIDDLNDSWGMIGISGIFGSNPYQLGRVLDKYGMDYTMVTTDEMNKTGVYIVSYRNPGSLSIHTIAVRYNGTNYIGHNPEKFVYPSSWGSRYICGYYLGE